MVIPLLDNILLFISAAILLIAMPGPAVLYIISKTTRYGMKTGLLAVSGIGLGAMVHVAAAAFGVSAILMASSMAFNGLKILGALYLIYLGFEKLLSKPKSSETTSSTEIEKKRKTFWEGVMVNVLNPKTTVFFFAFLPQFINPELGGASLQILFLGALFVIIALVSDCLYVILADRLMSRVGQSLKNSSLSTKVSAGIYFLLGIITLLVDRPQASK